jgi:4-aminobutyrate aminotransferase-like enzyme
MNTILDENLSEHAAEMGSYLKDKLKRLSEKCSIIAEIRGLGLMVGIQLTQDRAQEVKKGLFQKGYLVGSVGSSVIRLLPPLIIGKDDIDSFAAVLEEVLEAL